jgi:hypothetical protein
MVHLTVGLSWNSNQFAMLGRRMLEFEPVEPKGIITAVRREIIRQSATSRTSPISLGLGKHRNDMVISTLQNSVKAESCRKGILLA